MAKAIWNGVVLAESEKYELVEGNVYFPPGSVKTEYHRDSDSHPECPWKGLPPVPGCKDAPGTSLPVGVRQRTCEQPEA